MTDEEMAEKYVDTILNKDDAELDKLLDENLGDLKLTEKQDVIAWKEIIPPKE